jgi:hypothetical protein
MIGVAALTLILWQGLGPVFAAEQQAKTNDEAESTAELFQQQAAAYEFQDVATGKPLTFQAQPLLHWANPARNGEDGAVFLWTNGKQPAVIGTCFTYKYREIVRRKHAFRALSDGAIEGRHRDRVIWTPQPDSLLRRPLIGVPPPAANASGRKAQLSILARRFDVKLTQKDGRLEQCRLVPKPLYRFDDSDQASGAIFSFAIGTDPEALLILDKRLDESGKPTWHYAFARFSFYPLEGFLNNESVWKVEKSESLNTSILSRPDYQREPYITFRPDWLD